MTKRLQVILEDEMMAELKVFAARNGMSLKDIVTIAIARQIGVGEIPHDPKMVEPVEPIIEPVKEPVQFIPNPKGPEPGLVNVYTPPTYPNPLDDDPDYIDENKYYILRKTAKVGKPVKDYYQYQYRSLFWMVLDGCRMHFDKNGDVIPFRFTDEKGKVVEPDESDLKEIEEAFGKPVIIEK